MNHFLKFWISQTVHLDEYVVVVQVTYSSMKGGLFHKFIIEARQQN